MKLKTPLIIVNFKAYRQSTGKRAVKLAKICERVAKKHKANIAVAVEIPDIYQVASKVNIPVISQHVDFYNFGSHTGSVIPEDVRENGAIGTLINHSEHRVHIDEVKKYISRAKEAKLATVVCAETTKEAKMIARHKPDFIAIEPPELIGGNVSVSTAKPQLISKTVKSIKRIPVLCGAGVRTKEDVAKAIELGTKGILLASGVTKSRNPEKALIGLVSGLKKIRR